MYIVVLEPYKNMPMVSVEPVLKNTGDLTESQLYNIILSMK